jgi:hypothetical protein
VILLLLIAAAGAERSLVIDGKPLKIVAHAESAGASLAINLLVSSEERALLATDAAAPGLDAGRPGSGEGTPGSSAAARWPSA